MVPHGRRTSCHITTSCLQQLTLHVERYAGRAKQWDDFVRTQTGWTHNHMYGWRTVMQQSMRHDTPYLVATDSDTNTIRGVLPLVRVRSMLFGHFLVSVPFLNYGGPLGSPDTVTALAAHAATMASTEQVGVLELRNRFDIGALADFDVSHRKITVLMDSSGGSEAVWKRLPSKVRSQIRRPQKEGVTVRIGLDQARAFYRVFSRHMRDLGTPVMPWSFFQAIVEQFPESALFAVAYYGTTPIACGCLLYTSPSPRD